jgi:hypothetical protein
LKKMEEDCFAPGDSRVFETGEANRYGAKRNHPASEGRVRREGGGRGDFRFEIGDFRRGQFQIWDWRFETEWGFRI